MLDKLDTEVKFYPYCKSSYKTPTTSHADSSSDHFSLTMDSSFIKNSLRKRMLDMAMTRESFVVSNSRSPEKQRHASSKVHNKSLDRLFLTLTEKHCANENVNCEVEVEKFESDI